MTTPQTANAPRLLDPLSMGSLQLPNRVIMSPLTRCIRPTAKSVRTHRSPRDSCPDTPLCLHDDSRARHSFWRSSGLVVQEKFASPLTASMLGKEHVATE